ncbi:hypothetical protein [Kamptonema formosum]|uniref:hypothetical protein n=1 Tax=Kamptonema formosum TaxID=331992 RepID=UPI00035FBE7A|nr:hypothetical protein [Oscillatoria sp. PCC 10802]
MPRSLIADLGMKIVCRLSLRLRNLHLRNWPSLANPHLASRTAVQASFTAIFLIW